MSNKEYFLLLVQTGALSKDIKAVKPHALEAVHSAYEIPMEIFADKDASEIFLMAKDWVALEYDLFADWDDVTEWIREYLAVAKQKGSFVYNQRYILENLK